MKTLNDFIDETATMPKHATIHRTEPSIEPKKYIVAIQPKLDETAQPFTYTGAVYVTFVTNVDYVQSLQLQRNGVEQITILNVKIFRVPERHDGPVKRSADDSELLEVNEDGATPVESSTQDGENESEENVDTTTTKVSTTTPTTEATTKTTAAPLTSSTTTTMKTTWTTAAPVTSSTTTTTTTHPPATSSAPKETSNGYTSALEVFSNYFLRYEDRNLEMLIRDVIPDTFNDTITVRTRLSLRKATLYVVKIEFEGNMTETGHGFLLSSYLDETQTRRYGILSINPWHFNPINLIHRYFASTNTNSKLARAIFPSILHDKNHRIPFDIAILRRPHLTTLANSKLTKEFSYRINGIKWSLATFQTTKPMRVCDFSIVVTEIAPTLITSDRLTVYAYIREKKSPNFTIVDETLAKVTRAFENITGIEYYMNRINLVGVPNNRQQSIAPGMIVASENDFVRPTRAADQIRRIADAVLLFAKLWYLPIAQYENGYDLWLNDAMPLYLQWYALNSVGGNEFFIEINSK